ncbi:hypothetical protein D3C71_1570980 [compost metagenome]
MMGIKNGIGFCFLSFDSNFFKPGGGIFPLVVIPVALMRVIFKFYLVKIENICSDIGYTPGDVLVKANNNSGSAGKRYSISV